MFSERKRAIRHSNRLEQGGRGSINYDFVTDYYLLPLVSIASGRQVHLLHLEDD